MHPAPTIFDTHVPSGLEATLAKVASRSLTTFAPRNADSVIFRIASADKNSPTIEIPAAAFSFLQQILARMAEGQPVRLMPLHAELTTQEAADLLAVSRPFLITLLDAGKIPFRKVGTHRRILVKELLTYKDAEERNRREALAGLVALQQDLGLDD